MSGWQKYVDATLGKERSILFDAEERETINKVRERLSEKGCLEAWDSIDHEMKLNLVRGYWERSHRARDTADVCAEVYKWRRENKIDELLTKRMPLHDIYHKAWPSYVGGEDIYGHWFILDRVEELEVAALTEYDDATVLLYRAQCLEALVRIKQEVSLRLGYRVCQYIYCLDLKGLSINKHFTNKVRNILQPLFKVSGDFYPDSLWNLFLINAPMSFRMIWRIISPWIDPVVKHKIRILAGPSVYLNTMTKTGIPLEALPEQIGGKCKCITLREVVERLIDEPDVEDHGFVQFTSTPDPKARAHHKEQQERLDKGEGDSPLIDLAKRLSAGINRGLRLKNGSRPSKTSGKIDDLKADGEMIYNGDDVIMQGYMSKMGHHNTAWRRRYFVLTTNGLFYFTSFPTKESHHPRGKVELHTVSLARVKDAEAGLCEVLTPYRAYQLRVDSADGDFTKPELVKRWVAAVATAAENDICALDPDEDLTRTTENNIFSGFMEKRGVFNSSFRRRYFVLTSRALYYYNDVHTNVGASLKGRIDLYKVKSCDVSKKSDMEFDVAVPGRTYHFRAVSPTDAEAWLKRISDAVEEEQAKKKAADKKTKLDDDDMDDEGQAQPPMVRSLDSADDAMGMLGRTTSTIVDQLTSLAEEFYTMAGEMGILVKPEDGEEAPDRATVSDVLRKRTMHMFKLF